MRKHASRVALPQDTVHGKRDGRCTRPRNQLQPALRDIVGDQNGANGEPKRPLHPKRPCGACCRHISKMPAGHGSISREGLLADPVMDDILPSRVRETVEDLSALGIP